jgi:hyperosmotically inducible protein
MYLCKSLTVCGLALLLVATATANKSYAQTTAKTTVVVDDSKLENRVETALKAQPTLKGQDIDVKVDHGVVTLTGAVQTEQRKLRAARAAHVAGVTRVDNKLTVDPHAGREMTDKAADATKTAAKKTGEVVKTAGEKTKDAAVATGDVITDAWINTRIHSKMVDEAPLKGSDINVDVNDHVVTLKGTVLSAAGKARAEEIARTTEGVRSVKDMLTIGPKK